MKDIILRLSLSAALLCAATCTALAQDIPLYRRGYTVEESTMPPSPEPASAVRRTDMHLSLCRGMAEYDVPFKTIKGRELSIPISLHYASGGIKVDEIAGVAGLGWNLVAGGCVTRTVIDMPDEFTAPFMEHAMPSGSLLDSLVAMAGTDTELLFLGKLTGHRTDSSLDRFAYNVMGLSGSFVITDDGSVFQLEGDGVRIIPERRGTEIVSFTITGPDGTVYVLSDTEEASHDGSGDTPFTPTSGEPDRWDAVTTWHLTSVTSPSGLETASFSYSSGGTWERDVYSVRKTLSCTKSTAMGENTSTSTETSFIANSYRTKVLSSISLSGFTASFSYAEGTGRCRHAVTAGSPAMNFPVRLAGISVTAPSGVVTDSLMVGTERHPYDGRIILSSLRLYRRGTLDDRWDFTYKTLATPVSRYSQDWFGFYNAEVEEGTPRGDLCPFTFEPNTSAPVLNYGQPDPSAAQYMSLLSADHDGAKTSFTYEGSSVSSSPGTVYVGIRVAKMTLSDAGKVKRIRRITYSGTTADGAAYPTVDMYATVSASLGMVSDYIPSYSWSLTLHEAPATEGPSTAGTRVLAARVTDDDFADKFYLGPTARTVWKYDVTGMRFGERYTIARFPAGWASYYNDPSCSPSMVSPWVGVRDCYDDDGPALDPVPLRREVYSCDSGAYTLVSSTDWSYGTATRQSVLTGYRASQVMRRLEYGHMEYGDIYHYPVYTTSTLGRTPTKVVNVGYHASGNDTTTVNSTYVTRLSIETPVRLASVSSSEAGTLRSLSFDYPDTWQGAGPWTAALRDAHRLDSPIRKQYRVISPGGPLPVPALKTETYSYGWAAIAGSQRLMPVLHRELNLGKESWQDSVITRDCLGSVSSFKEKGIPETVVLRSYSGLHPVAVIRNATMQQVAAALGGQAAVDAITVATAPSTAMMLAIAGLRSSLQGALVFTFSFEPGTGMTSATDPAGVTTSYSYDHGGRLASVRDGEGNLVSAYTYSLLNNGGNGKLRMATRTYRSDDALSYAEDVRWWNTLGLVTQDIAIAGAGDGRDLVYAHGHDVLLHDDAKAWLPYPAAATAGAFQAGAEAAAAAFHGTAEAYSMKGYEMSVRDRVVSTALPGYASSHPASYSDDIATGMPLLLWSDSSGVDSLGVYPAQALVRETTADPDGRVAFTVNDHFGRMIAQYAGVDGTSPASSRALTRYVYDRFDRIRAIIPPGVALSDTLSMWRYSYDALGRLASKGVPGCARETYGYDSEDRMILLSRGGDLSETSYDAHGRAVAVHVTPVGGTRVLSQEHFHDSYPAAAAGLMAQAGVSGTWNGPSAGLETFRREAVFSDDGAAGGYVSTLFLYDPKERPVVTLASFPDGSILRQETTYGFSGEVLSSVTRCTRDGGTGTTGNVTDTLSQAFTYDIRGRLTSAASSLGTAGGTASAAVRSVSSVYRYDDLGRPAGRTVSTGGSTSLASLDAYALQGWACLHADSLNGAPLFEEALVRDGAGVQAGATPSYSGLITGKTETWTLPVQGGNAVTASTATAFAYDGAARLVREWTSSSEGTAFTYDRTGNIRSAVTTEGGSTVTDSYSYSGPRLASLSRTGAGTLSGSFSYDALGRMTADGFTGIGVTYNTMDLPARVSASSGALLAGYAYTAGGAKTEAMDASGRGLLYRGPFVYRKDEGGGVSLESAAVPEGRITPSGALLYVTDHLGSVRAVVEGTTGNVLQAADYSAYGSRSDVQAGGFVPAAGTAGITLRDSFSGKEDQGPDFGLQWLDFGARAYSPALRRWMTPDPLGEKYPAVSPYAYCAGDPVNYVDPTGMDIWEIDERGNVVYHIKDNTTDAFYLVDKDRNRTGKHISFDYGTIKESDSQYSGKAKTFFDWYTVRGDSNAEQLFQFMAENTSVEWSWLSMGIKGENGLNVISTSHEDSREQSVLFLLDSKFISYTIRLFAHSHPNDTPYPSGLISGDGDISIAFKVAHEQKMRGRSGPSFKIYLPGKKCYLSYDQYSTSYDFGIETPYLPTVTIKAY